MKNPFNPTDSSFLGRLSIRSKFFILILAMVIPCIAFIGYQGLYYGRDVLTESIYNQLTSLRSARAQQLEKYFSDKRGQMEILAENLMIIDAMKEFSAGYSLLQHYKKNLSKVEKDNLKKYYEEQFIPELEKNTKRQISFSDVFPTGEVTQYLQYHYIAKNPNAFKSKSLLKNPEDESYYSEVHIRFHSLFKKIIEKYDYQDLFLINHKTENIVYSVSKETDFASGNKEGVYRSSSLSRLISKVKENKKQGIVFVKDFEKYKASHGTPAAFFATPIYDENHKMVGILATKISPKGINQILTGNQRWSEDGLGATGEVYLVGHDFKMRSDLRIFLEDKDNYKPLQVSLGMKPAMADYILAQGTTVLNQRISTEATHHSIMGETGVNIISGYRKKQTLSAYAPLNISNLHWSIIAEKEVSEVNKPIIDFQHILLISASLLGALITFISLWLANRFVKPIYSLRDGIISAQENNNIRIELDRRDEFGQLANAFNSVLENAHSQQKVIKKQSKKIKSLMLNMMPAIFVSRVENEEKDIADSYSNVAVLFTNLRGLSALMDTVEPSESIHLFNSLIDAYDTVADKHGVEKVKTVGDSYVAACGLSKPRLDYAKRSFEFAKELFVVVEHFNQKHNVSLSLSVSISSGDITAGIIGRKRYSYDIWGKTVTIASRLRYEAAPNAICVSQSIYQQLSVKDDFSQKPELEFPHLGKIVTWEYSMDHAESSNKEDNA